MSRLPRPSRYTFAVEFGHGLDLAGPEIRARPRVVGPPVGPDPTSRAAVEAVHPHPPPVAVRRRDARTAVCGGGCARGRPGGRRRRSSEQRGSDDDRGGSGRHEAADDAPPRTWAGHGSLPGRGNTIPGECRRSGPLARLRRRRAGTGPTPRAGAGYLESVVPAGESGMIQRGERHCLTVCRSPFSLLLRYSSFPCPGTSWTARLITCASTTSRWSSRAGTTTTRPSPSPAGDRVHSAGNTDA